MNKVLVFLFANLLIFACLLVSSCVSPAKTTQGIAKESALTPGMTKAYIQRGKTNQTEILEIFGPPDLVTHKAGRDVWTYDKLSNEVSTSEGYLTIILGGVSGSKRYESMRSVMLIIYFDENETVIDYALSAAKF